MILESRSLRLEFTDCWFREERLLGMVMFWHLQHFLHIHVFVYLFMLCAVLLRRNLLFNDGMGWVPLGWTGGYEWGRLYC